MPPVGAIADHSTQPALNRSIRTVEIVEERTAGWTSDLIPSSAHRLARRLLEKEADRLAAGIWAAWVGVGSGRAAAGPCVTEAMNHPLLQNLVAASIGMHGAAVASTSRRLSSAERNPKICRRLRLCDDLIAIDGADGHVPIAVEYDCANGATSPQICTRTCPHGCECGWHVGGGSTGQAGMNAKRFEQIRISCSHDRGRRATRGKAGDRDACCLDLEVAHDLAANSRDQRWLPLTALLVACLEPVPALGRVG